MIFGKRAFFGYSARPSGEIYWFANLPRVDEPTRQELAAIDTSGVEAPVARAVRRRCRTGERRSSRARATSGRVSDPRHACRSRHGTRAGIVARWETRRMRHRRAPARVRRWPLKTRSCWRSACATFPTTRAAFAAYAGLRRDRVEKIVKYSARDRPHQDRRSRRTPAARSRHAAGAEVVREFARRMPGCTRITSIGARGLSLPCRLLKKCQPEGRRQKGKGRIRDSRPKKRDPLPCAVCPLPFALCPLPFALCPLPFALCLQVGLFQQPVSPLGRRRQPAASPRGEGASGSEGFRLKRSDVGGEEG